jgi:hypothetical protein
MMANPEDDLELEKQADYRAYSLAGGHHEMGRQWAAITKGQEVQSLTREEAADAAQLLGLPVDAFAPPSGAGQNVKGEQLALTPSQLAFAEECLQVVCNFHPPLLDEFQGWCQALGVDIDWALGALILGMDERPHACSTFAWQTAEGMLVGRNYDFFYWARTRHLIHAKPDVYYASVGMNDGLLGGRHEGVNERGLFVALSKAITKPPAQARPGVIFHLVPRILLETCATAREAVMVANEMPHLTSYCYLVADPDEMFVVEAHPEVVRVRESKDGYIVATNHYLHPELQGLMESPIQKHSERRLASVVEALKNASSDDDPWEAARVMLSDHQTPVCGHTDGLATLWSMIANLTDHRLAYSLGAPCRNDYLGIPWPGTSQDMPIWEQTPCR